MSRQAEQWLVNTDCAPQQGARSAPEMPQNQLPWQGTKMLWCSELVDDFSFASPEYLKLTLAAGLTHSKKKQGPSNGMLNYKGSH